MQDSTEPLIVDFSAESRGCAPCLLLSPQLELIAKEYEGRMRVVKIDTDKCLALTSAMKVRANIILKIVLGI
jgi:thioredoxin 1